MDAGFPHIVYDPQGNATSWGQAHGEHYRQAIQELAHIRKELMLAKNPALKNHLDELALKQADLTKVMSFPLYQELIAIASAASVTLTDLVILNNYTDFRDIAFADEGCTTLAMVKDDVISAQTWDMHASAKNYLATLELADGSVILTLTGCLGMMGVSRQGLFIGVNNLNTTDATDGVLWPALVRHILEQTSYEKMQKEIEHAAVTSGHNYLLGDGKNWCHIERSPSVYEISSTLEPGHEGVIFHTNHCLTKKAIDVQDQISANSTTHDRYQIMETKKNSLKNQQDILTLLQSHEGHPKSICSHFQSGAQDPSTTCGGGLYNHKSGEFLTWRGCAHEDSNYKERTLMVKE